MFFSMTLEFARVVRIYSRSQCALDAGTFSWQPVGKALTLAVLAQTLATLRCCAMVRDVIILADIFEEEDFFPSTFGFRLSPPVKDDSLMDLLELAMVAMADRVSFRLSYVRKPHDVFYGLLCFLF